MVHRTQDSHSKNRENATLTTATGPLTNCWAAENIITLKGVFLVPMLSDGKGHALHTRIREAQCRVATPSSCTIVALHFLRHKKSFFPRLFSFLFYPFCSKFIRESLTFGGPSLFYSLSSSPGTCPQAQVGPYREGGQDRN